MGGTKIRAAVCREFGAPLEIETLLLPPPGPRQVQIEVDACAICHSDITYMDGGWGGAPPFVLGHEVAGRVAIAGADSGYAVGARVIATLIRSCGECGMCGRRAPALCERPAATAPLLDAAGAPVAAALNVGGFAEQVVVDCSQVVAMPDALPADEASLLACGVLTGWGAVDNTAALPAGASVAVIGCGGVGLNCLQAAAHAGARPLCAIDLHDDKLVFARQFGADCVVNAAAEGAVDAARAAGGGEGFDYVFMAAGGARAVEFAAALLAPLGTLVLAGMAADGDLPRLSSTGIAHYQQRILGSKMGGAVLPDDVLKLVDLHRRGRLALKPLIAERYALADINAAIAAAKSGGALKSVVLPNVT